MVFMKTFSGVFLMMVAAGLWQLSPFLAFLVGLCSAGVILQADAQDEAKMWGVFTLIIIAGALLFLVCLVVGC